MPILDLNGIKDEIKTVFDLNNTTTSSFDLSTSLSTRVQKVLTVHPEMINPQASFYPFLTCYIVDKQIDVGRSTIGKDQVSVNRMAEVMIEVIGAVWMPITTSNLKDPADNEITQLMENAELVLRNYPSLNGKVKWQIPTGVKFYTAPLNEQTHLRAGIMSVKASVYY